MSEKIQTLIQDKNKYLNDFQKLQKLKNGQIQHYKKLDSQNKKLIEEKIKQNYQVQRQKEKQYQHMTSIIERYKQRLPFELELQRQKILKKVQWFLGKQITSMIQYSTPTTKCNEIQIVESEGQKDIFIKDLELQVHHKLQILKQLKSIQTKNSPKNNLIVKDQYFWIGLEDQVKELKAKLDYKQKQHLSFKHQMSMKKGKQFEELKASFQHYQQQSFQKRKVSQEKFEIEKLFLRQQINNVREKLQLANEQIKKENDPQN